LKIFGNEQIISNESNRPGIFAAIKAHDLVPQKTYKMFRVDQGSTDRPEPIVFGSWIPGVDSLITKRYPAQFPLLFINEGHNHLTNANRTDQIL